MKNRLKSSIVLGAACAALVAPAPASAAVHKCGSYDVGDGWTYEEFTGAGLFNVVGRNVSCRTARHVARHAYEGNRTGRKTWRYRGWKCRSVRLGYEETAVRCTKSRRRLVRWTVGA